jgi:riboflavin kinase/FMN adenylyltransferase
MQIIEWDKFLKQDLPLGDKPFSMTVGIFDGIHLGHRALIKRIVSYNADFTPVVITFRQNHKTKNKEEIQSFGERLEILESLGIKITVVIDFTEEFRKMPGIEFLKILLKYGNAGFFAAGNDFRCGYQLDTDAAAVKSFFASHGIPAEIVPDVMEDSLPVSSSRIRAAIAAGNTALAQKMLGSHASIL